MHIPLMQKTIHRESAAILSRIGMRSKGQTVSICLLGIDHTERTFYNLLEFSTA